MNHFTRITRLAPPSWAGVLFLLLVTGCQTGSQTDLVTRELRTQEEQIYALEDYLAQYQQLVCQYRSENAALKRQLADADDGDTLPAPTGREDPAEGGRRPRRNGPSFQSPGRAPDQEAEDVEQSEMEVIQPDVPPLEETTSADHEPAVVVASHEDEIGQGTADLGTVGDAGAEETPAHDSTQSMHELLQVSDEPPRHVQVRGTVIANETGGPRLQVDIEPLTESFEHTQFVGAVSMVIIDQSENRETSAPLAAWDFSSGDAQIVNDEMPLHQSMRFFLELPADAPTDRETELWVRLMPDSGDRVIAHVRMDLSRPGQFASMVGCAGPRGGWDESREGGEVAAIADRASVVLPEIVRGDDEGWTIARPDRPGQMPADGDDTDSQWRAATGPLPVVLAETVTRRPNHSKRPVQQAAFLEPVKTVRASPVDPVRATPAWSPERSRGKAADATTHSEELRVSTVERPVWSANR